MDSHVFAVLNLPFNKDLYTNFELIPPNGLSGRTT